jgi:hypothetical protein
MEYSMNIMPPEDDSAASLGIILLLVHIKSGLLHLLIGHLHVPNTFFSPFQVLLQISLNFQNVCYYAVNVMRNVYVQHYILLS